MSNVEQRLEKILDHVKRHNQGEHEFHQAVKEVIETLGPVLRKHPEYADAIAAGLDNHYIKPEDERVIAFTNIIGGGEKTSVTFSVDKLKAGEDYTFFCSFPGHIALMKGTVSLK